MRSDRRATLWQIATVIALFSTGLAPSLVGATAKKGSPDEALDKYYKMVNDGDLLTPEGWVRAAKLFVRQSAASKDGVIFVTTKFPLGNGPMDVNGDHAVSYQKWVDNIGTIDAVFRFHPPPKENLEVEGIMRIFRLVLTGKHWELAHDGRGEKELNGPIEWRIEGSMTLRSTSREAVIRYLTEKRDEIADPIVRKNVDRTLSILKGLPAPRTHI
jgi:hypothetical protein